MRSRNRRWLLAWTFTSLFPHIMLYSYDGSDEETPIRNNRNASNSKEIRGIFAPRMDYEQWTPLGRGDPLKNDPTYDYVPPVLDRVHYWIDPASRKPDTTVAGETQKTEILILGVSSKKPSTGTSVVADSRRDALDSFLKFVDGGKFGSQNSFQRAPRPHYSSPFFPIYKNKYLAKSEHVPYTMLMPPPLSVKRPPSTSEVMAFQQPLYTQQTSITSTTTTEYPTTKVGLSTEYGTQPSPVTIQQANLVYQSSTLGSQDDFRNNKQFGTDSAPSSQVTWKTPFRFPGKLNTTPKPNQIVFPESYMEVQHMFSGLANNISDTPVRDVITANTVTFSDFPLLHKGQVSDDDLGLGDTYVNIGKPEAQMHAPSGMEIASVAVDPPQIVVQQPLKIVPSANLPLLAPHKFNYSTQSTLPTEILTTNSYEPVAQSSHTSPVLTLQTLQTMQTMQPPPILKTSTVRFTKKPTRVATPALINKPPHSLHSLLKKEVTKPLFSPTNPQTPTLTTNSDIPTTTPPTTTITTTAPVTTTFTSLTTDPLFKHYKQPSAPLKGPMYLIIQGHSKVKTYGPSKQVHGIAVQETNEIPTSDEKDEYAVKHLHNYKKDMSEKKPREGRSNNIQTLSELVQSGIGSLEFLEDSQNRKNGDDIQETELVVGYDLASNLNTTSERYYKGIVEEGDLARSIEDVDGNN